MSDIGNYMAMNHKFTCSKHEQKPVGKRITEMKPAFMVCPTGRVVNAVLAKTANPTAFKVGQSVTFGHAVSLGEYGFVHEGCKAKVVSHDTETGLVDLEFIGPTPTIAPEWGSHLSLLPFENEEVLKSLNYAPLKTEQVLNFSLVKRSRAVAMPALLVIAFVVGWMLPPPEFARVANAVEAKFRPDACLYHYHHEVSHLTHFTT